MLQCVEIRHMTNPSQHNFESKIVTSRITWTDNDSHRHHGNIKQLTNLVPQKSSIMLALGSLAVVVSAKGTQGNLQTSL